jgi:FkbM family methyltransferase
MGGDPAVSDPRTDRLASAFDRAALRLGPWHAQERRRPGWTGRAHRAAGSAAAATLAAYARWEGPRCVGLVQACERAFPDWFPREGWRECRGLWHGYRLHLDCADYFQRLAWVLRRYHDGPLQRLIGAALEPGDVFVDGGANCGLISMYAAWRVGPAGRVHAFEPGRVRTQLDWHVRENRLSQVMVHAAGLSDRPEHLAFRVPDPQNLGAGTFAPIPVRYGPGGPGVEEEGVVPVVRADDVVELNAGGAVVIKLDVEGFEVRALEGMRGLIEHSNPLIVTEVNEEMLSMAGSSARQLWAWLSSRGYRAFDYSTGAGLLRRGLMLKEVPAFAEGSLPTDLAWVRPGGIAWKRLSPWMRR